MQKLTCIRTSALLRLYNLYLDSASWACVWLGPLPLPGRDITCTSMVQVRRPLRSYEISEKKENVCARRGWHGYAIIMDEGLWGVRGEPLFSFPQRDWAARPVTPSVAPRLRRGRQGTGVPAMRQSGHGMIIRGIILRTVENTETHCAATTATFLRTESASASTRRLPARESGCPLAALWLLTCASAMLRSTVPLNFHPLRSSPRPGDITSAHEEEATPAQSHRAWPPSPLHRIFFSSLFGIRRRTVHTSACCT